MRLTEPLARGCGWRPLKYEIICHLSLPCGNDVKDASNFPTEDWEHMVSAFKSPGALTNLQSPPFMVQDRLLPLLRASARKGGRPKIVNVASMAGRLRQLSRLRQVRQATSHIWNMRSWSTKHVLETDVGLSVICNYSMVYGILWQNWKWKDFYLICNFADLRNYSSNLSLVKIIPQSSQQDIPKKHWNKISPYRSVDILIRDDLNSHRGPPLQAEFASETLDRHRQPPGRGKWRVGKTENYQDKGM